MGALLWILLVLLVLALIGGAGLLGWWLWLRQMRRFLFGLVAQREAVRASSAALERVLSTLAGSDDEQMMGFANDEGHEERRSMEEIAARMRIVAEQMEATAYPKRFWRAANLVERAARAAAAEAGKIRPEMSVEGVLDGLAHLDVTGVNASLTEADAEIELLAEKYRVEDPAVYGGGLYI